MKFIMPSLTGPHLQKTGGIMSWNGGRQTDWNHLSRRKSQIQKIEAGRQKEVTAEEEEAEEDNLMNPETGIVE